MINIRKFCIDNNLANAHDKVLVQLRNNKQKRQREEAREWASIGATVNSSFYENRSIGYSVDETIQAIKDLGVDFTNIKGKKWYQFSSNDNEVKICNSLKQLN